LQKQDQAGNLPPKDAEKIKARLSKQTQTSEEADKAFRLSVEKMHEISTQWQMEMTQTSDVRAASVFPLGLCVADFFFYLKKTKTKKNQIIQMFQKLEEQRIDFVRSQLWTYSNILTAGCAADDVSNDRLRGSLEKCNIENDITVFVNEKATGKNVPEVIDYSTTRAAIVGGMPMPASSSSFSSSYNSNLSSSAPPSLSRESSSYDEMVLPGLFLLHAASNVPHPAPLIRTPQTKRGRLLRPRPPSPAAFSKYACSTITIRKGPRSCSCTRARSSLLSRTPKTPGGKVCPKASRACSPGMLKDSLLQSR